MTNQTQTLRHTVHKYTHTICHAMTTDTAKRVPAIMQNNYIDTAKKRIN